MLFSSGAKSVIEKVLNKVLNKTASLVTQTFKGLEMIFTGKANLKTDVGGPITITR